MAAQHVCNDIDRHVRGLIWDIQGNGKGLHLVNWETFTLPKKDDDLGIKTMKRTNIALLGKAVARIISNEEKFQVDIFKKRYLEDQ